MFWDSTDDPRGALRWSLSKLRVLDDEQTRIVADRQSVAFHAAGAEVDAVAVVDAVRGGLKEISTDTLRDLVERFRGEFLDDLELPELEAFQAWRVAMREELRQHHRALLAELVSRLESEPGIALEPARELVRLTPEDEAGRATLIRLLAACGRLEEAREHYSLGRRQIERLGSDRHKLQAAWRQVSARPEGTGSAELLDLERQAVGFCRSADGTRIAYATLGDGPPLVKTANWMSHLEYDWKCPLWRHIARELSREFQLVRYDQRGNGLSDWEVETFSLEANVTDLEAVVTASGLDQFSLLGISGGCRVAVEYVARHPERVNRLILYGGAARGWRLWPPEARAIRAGLQALIREGWGRDLPTFRQVFTTLFMPDASSEQMTWFNDLQRVSTTPENAFRITERSSDGDVTDLLDQVSVPTLVMHARGDAMVPFEEGRILAAGIPGARFVTLESNNHLLLDDEPAFARFLWEVRNFLRVETAAGSQRRSRTA